MVFPSTILKVVASGPMLQGREIWSTSWSMSPGFGIDATQPQDLEPLATAVGTWFASSGSFISTSAQLDLLKVNLVGPDGRYVSDGATYEYEYATPVSGSRTDFHPSQCSLVITTTTAQKRGLASLGRFFPPLYAGTVGGDGLILEATQASVGAAAVTLIESMNAAVEGAVVVNASSQRAGEINAVSGVRVGRVVDTQRRRRNNLNEEYQGYAIATPAA